MTPPFATDRPPKFSTTQPLRPSRDVHSMARRTQGSQGGRGKGLAPSMGDGSHARHTEGVTADQNPVRGLGTRKAQPVRRSREPERPVRRTTQFRTSTARGTRHNQWAPSPPDTPRHERSPMRTLKNLLPNRGGKYRTTPRRLRAQPNRGLRGPSPHQKS